MRYNNEQKSQSNINSMQSEKRKGFLSGLLWGISLFLTVVVNHADVLVNTLFSILHTCFPPP